MSMLSAWVLYPLVLAALCGGLGLGVDRLCGRRLPGTLLLPAGLAATIVIGGLTTLSDATAELTVPVIAVLATLGAGFSAPWRFGRPNPWPAAAALGVFFVFGAPVIFSGHPTFTGYIKLDDTATWFALTDRVMEHGHSLAGLEPSSYLPTLQFNLAKGYPIGAFIPFGTAQKLVGGDLAWVFQPYLSFLAAMLSLSLWEIAGGLLGGARSRALAAFIAAQPALLLGYALWGGIKEMTAAALIALAVALAPGALGEGGARATLPLAVAAGALLVSLSPGGMIWLAPMLLVLAALALARLDRRQALRRAIVFLAILALFAFPLAITGVLLPPTATPLTSSTDVSNLWHALKGVQVLGIWPASDFRLDPDSGVLTAVLIALAILAALAGLWAAWRKRALALLLYATCLISCLALVLIGSPWVGGKALATASPIALLLVICGALALIDADRPSGVALTAVLAGGVVFSSVLAYGGVSLAPYDQLHDLEEIGHRFAGQGPALMTEYSPYGGRHFLRTLDGESASELRSRSVSLRSGGSVEKGQPVDTDELEPAGLFVYRTLVLRRSPVHSRPPLPYRLVWTGRDFQVWQRPPGEVPPPQYLSLGSLEQPTAIPNCEEVAELARSATGGHLLAARHAPVLDASDGTLHIPRSGRYVAWLGGSVSPRVSLTLDGEEIGSARQELNNVGGFIRLGEARIPRGLHTVKLHFGGSDLHPGSADFLSEGGSLIFAPAGDERGEIVAVPAAQYRRLCGKRWDWIEVAGSS
jgi:hypothetical protein